MKSMCPIMDSNLRIVLGANIVNNHETKLSKKKNNPINKHIVSGFKHVARKDWDFGVSIGNNGFVLSESGQS